MNDVEPGAAVHLSGKTKRTDRDETIEAFRNGGGPRDLILKPAMFGFGVNLQTCHVQIFCPPWSVIMWDRGGNPRPVTTKLYGKKGWWVPAADMIDHRVADVVLSPRTLHAVIQEFDVDSLIDAIVARAEHNSVRHSIEAYLEAHPEIVAHGHD